MWVNSRRFALPNRRTSAQGPRCHVPMCPCTESVQREPPLSSLVRVRSARTALSLDQGDNCMDAREACFQALLDTIYTLGVALRSKGRENMLSAAQRGMCAVRENICSHSMLRGRLLGRRTAPTVAGWGSLPLQWASFQRSEQTSHLDQRPAGDGGTTNLLTIRFPSNPM